MQAVCRAAMAGLAVLSAAGGGRTDDLWRTDYPQAVVEAERLQRPLLMHFYGTYCPPCKRMEREVLHTRETMELLNSRFVAVKIDAGDAGNEQNMRLVQRFGIHSLPSDVILDPLSGRILSQKQGYQDQRTYLSTALESAGRFEQALKTQLARQSRTPPNEDKTLTTEVELGEPQPIVGMDRYSPVALTRHRQWIRGKPQFAWEHKGITYYLASRSELEEFRASPEDFAPKLLGCDPVLLLETDRAVAGDTRFAAFYDGELYLFQSAESRQRFKANPTRFTRIQHVLRVEHIERSIVR